MVRLPVYSEIAGCVYGESRNSVHALRSDSVGICQPLRCTAPSLTVSLVSLYEAWYTRVMLACTKIKEQEIFPALFVLR